MSILIFWILNAFSGAIGQVSLQSKPNQVTESNNNKIIYGNSETHCQGSPQYQINDDERYLIYGSVPFDYHDEILRNSTSIVGGFNAETLAMSCAFLLVAASDRVLHITFSDKNCRRWPKGCSLGIYKSETTALMDIPSPVYGCSWELDVDTNSLAISITSCQSTPNPGFNFSVTVSTRKQPMPNLAPIGAISGGIVIVAVILIVRCCVFERSLRPPMCCMAILSWCCPSFIRRSNPSNAYSDAPLPAESSIVTPTEAGYPLQQVTRNPNVNVDSSYSENKAYDWGNELNHHKLPDNANASNRVLTTTGHAVPSSSSALPSNDEKIYSDLKDFSDITTVGFNSDLLTAEIPESVPEDRQLQTSNSAEPEREEVPVSADSVHLGINDAGDNQNDNHGTNDDEDEPNEIENNGNGDASYYDVGISHRVYQ